jgi:maleylpyruvate isomerase
MQQGTTHFLAQLAALTDSDLQGPSLLPGWSRAHVVGHLARNADALARLATWARTGVETPMYTDRQQRAAEIDATAQLPAAMLRREALDTADSLGEKLALLDDATWTTKVRSAMGREIPATEIPWMRSREVWLHAIDLDSEARAADLPAGVVDTLLDDVVPVLSQRPECPAVLLRPSDRDRRWRLGQADVVGVEVVDAPAAEIVCWLTGRISGSTLRDNLPELPSWL